MASNDTVARVYDAITGNLLMSLSGHAGGVGGSIWSPDGTRIATNSADSTAKIWDAATGQHLFNLYGHTGGTGWVAFSPDGRRLVTAGGDGTVRMYVLQLDELVALAQSRVTRTLTTEECQQYLHLDACPVPDSVGSAGG
jgi:WD40 repeat protein